MQGRQYPVQIMYAPVPEDSYVDASLTTVLQVRRRDPRLQCICMIIELVSVASPT